MMTSSCIWPGSLRRGCLIRHACPVSMLCFIIPVLPKVSKGAKIRNRYNQVPHLTQDTSVNLTNSQLDTTNRV